MVITPMEMEVTGKFLCLHNWKFLKNRKLSSDNVGLMEFSIKKSTATKAVWDEVDAVVPLQFRPKWTTQWVVDYVSLMETRQFICVVKFYC